jgi:hypothetical protein
MRVLKNFVALCLLVLPAAAFADIYPLNGPPDISIDGISFTDNGSYATLSGGSVETLIDGTGTGCQAVACEVSSNLSLPWVVMSANSTGFTIFDNDNPSTVYMTASLIAGSYQKVGTEVGEKFLVTYDDLAFWNYVESTDVGAAHTVSATNLLNTVMVLDLHLGVKNSDGIYDAAFADMTPVGTPVVTPEPATLTLLCSGLAAGVLRKRFAGNKK